MKYLFIIVLLLIGYCSNAQVYQEMPQYGYRANRMSFDSTLQIPTTCGVPTLKSVVNVSKKAAIAFDSCNKRFYYYNPKLQQWDTIKSGTNIDTTSLSNRINLKLNITDTANKWINSLYRKAGKDSIFYKIGSTEYAIKDSAGGVQNGRFGNDTATIVMAKVHNDAGSPLTNGEVVFFSKSGTSSDAPSVKRAYNKADSTSANTFGFVKGTIATNDTGYVILYGKIEKLNTSAFSNGDIIYLDSIAGKYTKTKPKAPYHLVYLGVVVKSNAGNGAIYVRVQNGFEIEELHDVQINSALNNQVIVYSDTQKLWKNRNIYSIVDTTSLSNRINNLDLQAVTNNGDTTNHSLYIQSLKLYDGVNNGYGSIDNSDKIYTFKDYNGNNIFIVEEGVFTIYNGGIASNIFSPPSITGRSYYLPDTSGTFVLQVDSASLFQTKYRTDTMRNNIYSGINGKQSKLNGTGFVKASGTTISYDNSTYLASSGYDWNLVQGWQAMGSSLKGVNLAIPQPGVITSGQNMTTNQVRFMAFYLNQATTLTGVKWANVQQGNYTANNYNGVGLYTANNGVLTLVDSTANDGNIWKATNSTFASKAFYTPYNAQPGIYYVGVIWSSSATTTTPGLGGLSIVGSTMSLDFTNNNKLCGSLNGQSNLPSTINLSATSTNTSPFAIYLY